MIVVEATSYDSIICEVSMSRSVMEKPASVHLPLIVVTFCMITDFAAFSI